MLFCYKLKLQFMLVNIYIKCIFSRFNIKSIFMVYLPLIYCLRICNSIKKFAVHKSEWVSLSARAFLLKIFSRSLFSLINTSHISLMFRLLDELLNSYFSCVDNQCVFNICYKNLCPYRVSPWIFMSENVEKKVDKLIDALQI